MKVTSPSVQRGPPKAPMFLQSQLLVSPFGGLQGLERRLDLPTSTEVGADLRVFGKVIRGTRGRFCCS